ncbi:MAG: translocation/assembly module TamB domain-containing protein, partial [Chitinophagaceae bacterium]|nr:translocation/assembly module TamB domain-containing protein [Chitinophagaceae bacterium]
KKLLVDTGLSLNPSRMFLQVASLKITNGNFVNIGNDRMPLNYFDADHLNFSKLDASFTNILLNNDTLKINMDLSCKERSGIDLKRLKTNFKVTPQIMELANLDLKLNKSKLGNYFAMKFNHFNADFGEYVTNVLMDAKFSSSKVFSDDIAFFAPSLKTWKKEFDLTGNFLGTVADFNINNMLIKTGGSYINGTLAMKGLPDIDKTKITFNKGSLQTNYSDLSIVVPSIKNVREPNLAALGSMIFRGSFNGYVSDFKAKGNISTNLGNMYADLAMKFPARAEPSYNGILNTNRFNLGKFLNADKVGMVDFNGKISGSSFSVDKLRTTIDGSIRQLEYNGYTYTNIVTKGTFQKKYFTGELKVSDPNLDFTSTVEVDFAKDQPRINILGDFVKSNLKNLNITKDNLELTGALDVNFTGTTIDNFSGEAKLLNANIKSDAVDIKFDSLNLVSGYINNVKYLRLATNDFSANINGEFSIIDLPKSFQSFLHRYYPSYINEPTSIPKNQQFVVSITTGVVDPYLKLIDKKLTGFNDAKIEGVVDTKNNLFNFSMQVPFVKYDNYSFTGVNVKGKGNLDSLALTSDIASIQLSDSLYLPTTKLNIVAANDHSIVSINTKANNTLNDADLYADVYTLEDGVRIKFRPSAFVLNEKKWNIEKEGELVLRKNFVDAKNVKFVQGFQEIDVETELDTESNANNLNVKLKNLVLGDFTSLLHINNPKFEGIASGDIKLKDFFGDFYADANLKAEQFRMDEDSIGLVNIKASYDSKSGEVKYDILSPNEKYNFTAKGYYKTKDSTSTSNMENNIHLNNTRLTIIQKYLKGIFSGLDGYGTGDLKISGKPNSLNLLGNVKIKNAGMKVDYTQVYYYIDSALIKFEEDGMDFGEFAIYDDSIKATRNKGMVRGKLYEKNFSNMAFDFELNTNKLLLLNTKPKDNQQFYGKAIGKAALSFKGPESDAKMVIVGEANDTSHIFLPNSSSKQSGDADFIVFKQFGTEMDNESKKSNFNLSVDLDITATNDVAIDVILDELSGDVIKANGNGRLRIKAGTNEKLDIRGRYNIESGNYDFNFQSFIRRPFVLLPNAGNYIEWTGDAFRADLHIDAQYTAENISLGDLINNTSLFQGGDNSLKAQRGPVYVIAQLRDKLNQPKINFKIDFPLNSPAKTNPDFAQFLSRIEKDDNEMITQATSLIVFGSFTPYGQGLLANGGPNYTSIGFNSISQQITNQINKRLSDFLFRLFKDKSLRFDIGASVYSTSNIFGNGLNASSNKLDRTNFNFKIVKSFFNNNVILNFGADLDFNFAGTSTAAQSGNLQWLPDLNIEIVLSKDKRLRAIIFNKNSLDISGSALGRRNRQGISISYSKDFENLFSSKTPIIDLPVYPRRKEDGDIKFQADSSAVKTGSN